MSYTVVKWTGAGKGLYREEIASFDDPVQAAEYARTLSEQPKVKGVTASYVVEPLSKRPTLRRGEQDYVLTSIRKLEKPTISKLISDAISIAGGRAQLKQIYSVVQKEKPGTSEHSIRGVLNHGVADGKFKRYSDHTYSLGLNVPRTEAVPRRPSPTSGAIAGGNLFHPIDVPEKDLEKYVIQYSTRVFGPDSLFIPKKKLVGSHIKKVTDGLLFDLADEPAFWIVEIELGSHDAEHIETQINGFIRSLKHDKSLRSLVDTVYDYVKESETSEEFRQWYDNSFVPAFTDANSEEYKFIHTLLHKNAGVMVVIDEMTRKLKEVLSDISDKRPVKVIEFKTFWLKDQLIHIFSQPDLSQSD